MTKLALKLAHALYPKLDNSAAKAQTLLKELSLAAEVLNTAKARQFFAASSTANLQKILTKVFAEFSPLLLSALMVLARFQKLSELNNLKLHFQQLITKNFGVLPAEIESPSKLTPDQLKQLTTALNKISGKKVFPKVKINSQILGGLKIHLADEIIDLSLRAKLVGLKSKLIASK